MYVSIRIKEGLHFPGRNLTFLLLTLPEESTYNTS